MERVHAAGVALGRGFEGDALKACQALKANISYHTPDAHPLWLITIPSSPVMISVLAHLTPEERNCAFARALAHIVFHHEDQAYTYRAGFAPRLDRDEEYEEARVFAEAFQRACE